MRTVAGRAKEQMVRRWRGRMMVKPIQMLGVVVLAVGAVL
jgi:hypothetical protein